jgi:hypothetical protein
LPMDKSNLQIPNIWSPASLAQGEDPGEGKQDRWGW